MNDSISRHSFYLFQRIVEQDDRKGSCCVQASDACGTGPWPGLHKLYTSVHQQAVQWQIDNAHVRYACMQLRPDSAAHAMGGLLQSLSRHLHHLDSKVMQTDTSHGRTCK